MNIIEKVFQHNWWAILYFNFRMLPFRQAIHLPFDFYHKVRFDRLDGKLRLNAVTLYRGIVKIGGRGSDIFPRSETVLSLSGDITFNGRVEIGNGASVVVLPGASLSFGNNVTIGAYDKIYCEQSITFGSDIAVSWESQIFDTNFHEMEKMPSGEKIERCRSVVIGSFNWIGNRCNVMKGTCTPEDITVAANSLLNKDYTMAAVAGDLLAGSPARVVKHGIHRNWLLQE